MPPFKKEVSMSNLEGPPSPLSRDSDGILPGGGHLSMRCLRACTPVFSYIGAFNQAVQDQWSSSNPKGNIILAVAENKISCDLILPRVNKESVHGDMAMSYGPMTGTDRFRAAVADMMEATFLKGAPVDPSKLICQAGCTGIIESLAMTLCNEGDAMLLPAPYYPAFDNDLMVKSKVEALPVFSQQADGYLPTIKELEAARLGSERLGVTVRAVLLCNPNNPTGVIYPKEVMVAIIRWALEQNIHVISDEIYANSIFGDLTGEECTPFWSAGRLLTAAGGAESEDMARGRVDEFVHVVYGMSKDWCMSGYRVGYLYTNNSRLHQAFGNIACFSTVPGYIQEALAPLLEDSEFVRGYVQKNRELRALLPESATWADEWDLFQTLAQEDKIVMSPGQPCHAEKPGYFRCCWAWVGPDALEVLCERLARRAARGRRAARRGGLFGLGRGPAPSHDPTRGGGGGGGELCSVRGAAAIGLIPVFAAVVVGCVVSYCRRV